jgi:hypothetical protein
VDKAVKAAIVQQAGPVAETEPTRPAAPETPAAPPAPKRELHELSTEELRAATREDLNRLLAHMDGETRPTSPFWRGQDAPKAHGDQ